MLSDVVAERLVKLRKDARLSREEFAERCRQLGMTDFTAATLGNIETGRRDKEGRRRRKIEVDEAPFFAAALGVPLSWLLSDPESTEPVALFGETKANPWRALGWVTGAWPLDESPGPAWTEAADYLGHLRELYMHIRHYDLLRQLYDPRYHPEPPVGMTEDESKRRGLKAIWERLEPFRIGGMPLPPLPEHISEGIGDVLLYQVNKEIEGVQEMFGLRSVAAEWIPDGQAREVMADTVDGKELRRLSEALRHVANWGLPLPVIPDAVSARAKELDINLTPWRDSSPG